MLPLGALDSREQAGRPAIVHIRGILQALWLPAALLAATALLAALAGKGAAVVESVPPYLAWGAVLSGLLLGWRFRRGRVVLALAVLALSYVVVGTVLTGRPGGDALGQVLYAGLALLLPLDLLAIALLPERDPFGATGAARLGLLLLQGVLLAWLAWAATPEWQDGAARLLHGRLLPAAVDRWTHLPQPALLAFLAAGLALIGRVALGPEPIAVALLTALIAAGAALHRIGDATVPTLYLTAALLAVVLAMVQESYRLAFVDELTALPGRRALVEQMKRLGGSYAVAMVDVDHFKQFNDSYGHDVGDQVLKMVAGCLARAPGAKAYRYGGEEFTLLYPGLDAETAQRALEEVRRAIAASQFRRRAPGRPKQRPPGAPRRAGRGEGGLSVTVSVGVAQRGNGSDKPEEVLKAADLALYGAKRAGRNRVERYRPRRRRRRETR